MTLRVAISTSSFGDADRAPLDTLQRHGVEFELNPHRRRLTEDEVIAHLNGKDGLLAGLEPLTERVFEGAPQLRAIARVGIGMHNVDVAAAEARGIRVSNTPEPPTEAVAEMTVAALLAIRRRLVELNGDMHAGRWKKRMAPGLGGATVLLVGYGRIGRRTGELLRAFGCRLMVCDPAVTTEQLTHGETSVTLEEGLAAADVVSLHASGSACIVGKEHLDAVRSGAVLLNSARGELVDEAAVAEALRSGQLGAAWFDAFAEEPYEGALAGLDNCLLTPHAATYTRRCRARMEAEAVSNILRDLGMTVEDACASS